MKRSLLILTFLLMAVLVIAAPLLSQNKVEERDDLSQELIEQAQVFSKLETTSKDIELTVLQFQGTPEEALKYALETFFKDDSKKPEMEFNKDSLAMNLRYFRGFAESGMISGLDQEWITEAEAKEKELEDEEQISGFAELEYPNLKKELSIVNPFFSPLSFRLEAGTYIIYSEDELSQNNDSQIRGESIELSDKKVLDFLIGDWKLQQRVNNEESYSQIPEVRISIKEMIGSILESEIALERYLFSGEIKINAEQYQAYKILDPVSIYEYPIRYISLIDEGNGDYRLEILVSRLDDYYFEIYSDLENINANSIEINLIYEGVESSEDNYQTEANAVDYLIRE